MEKDLQWYKDVINYYVKILSKNSDSVIRSRLIKEFGYGRFYFEEITTHSDCITIELQLWFKQKGYKDHCIIKKRWKVDDLKYLVEFYAMFLDDLIIHTACRKTSEKGWNNSEGVEINCYSFADLINKGLPDKDKI